MQLDFDLHAQPPKPPEPKIHSVGEITRRIRQLLEGGIGAAWVEGEISNLRVQSSGHRYFTLKDSSSQLPCVLFSQDASALRGVNIADGMQVQIYGELSVYEPRGQYQMIVRMVQARGAGALQARFEALKKKLADEGALRSRAQTPDPCLSRARSAWSLRRPAQRFGTFLPFCTAASLRSASSSIPSASRARVPLPRSLRRSAFSVARRNSASLFPMCLSSLEAEEASKISGSSTRNPSPARSPRSPIPGCQRSRS